MANILQICPIHPHWAEQTSCALMIKSSVYLDVLGNGRVQGLPVGYDPVQNWPFHTFGVIRSGAVGTILNLTIGNQKRK